MTGFGVCSASHGLMYCSSPEEVAACLAQPKCAGATVSSCDDPSIATYQWTLQDKKDKTGS